VALSLIVMVQILAQDRQPRLSPQFDQLPSAEAAEARSVAEQRAAAFAAHQFDEKYTDFIREFDTLTTYRIRGTFNLKQAKRVSAAWRKLRADPGWLEKKTPCDR
jgi:hypothetical protein